MLCYYWSYVLMRLEASRIIKHRQAQHCASLLQYAAIALSHSLASKWKFKKALSSKTNPNLGEAIPMPSQAHALQYPYVVGSLCTSAVCMGACTVCMRNNIIIRHPSPSNSQHEHTICMNYYTLVAWLLLTPDHYQEWITVKLHILAVLWMTK